MCSHTPLCLQAEKLVHCAERRGVVMGDLGLELFKVRTHARARAAINTRRTHMSQPLVDAHMHAYMRLCV